MEQVANQNDPSRPEDFDADVLIVGAGPSGLTLAAALAAGGIRTAVIDRLTEGANTSRAAVVHARTLEVLEPLGVSSRLVERGLQAPRFTIRDRDRVLMPIDFDALPTQYPYSLMVSQAVTERVLLQRFVELGGQVLRPRELTALMQDSSGATATLDDGRRLRARYVVGADGMHSTVRESAHIGFSGGSYAEAFVLADVRLCGGVPDAEVILYFSPAGMVVVAPLPDGLHRIVATVDEAPEHPSAAYVQALARRAGPQARACRRARGAVGFPLPRPPPRGRRLPCGPSAPGRRCCPCTQSGGRPGHERRHPRRDEPGRRLEQGTRRRHAGARCLWCRAPSCGRTGDRPGRPTDAPGYRTSGIARLAQPAAVDDVPAAAGPAQTCLASFRPGVSLSPSRTL